MSNKKNSSQKYTDDFNTWQRNQYLPGAYTGGNFPPDIKYGGRKFGYTVLIPGLVILLFGILMVLQTDNFKAGIGTIIFGLVVSYAGWNKVRRSKRK
jgi:hypothetical protein